MASRNDYSSWSKEDLIKKIKALEKRKKYGLVWDSEREPEKVVLDCQKELPVLKEIKYKEIQSGKDDVTHILIEGDNYHALSVLNYTHEKTVDLIYIDPPYNTGTDEFSYNDRYIDKEDPYRHTKWLSFMEKRLKLAKNLLKKTGVIAVSINEEEQAQLKLMCDDIFAEENYLTMFSVKVRHEERILKGDKDFHEVIEYLYLYRKSHEHRTVKRIRDNTSLEEYTYKIRELTKTPQIMKFGSKVVQVFKPGDFEVNKTSPDANSLKKISIRGSIKEGNSSGRFYMRHLDPITSTNRGYLIKVPNMGDDGLEFRYFLVPSSDKRINGDYFQGVPLNRADTKEVPFPNFLDFVDEFNNVGYEGGVEFRNGKKPVAFINHIFEIGGVLRNKNAVILDFFAGSGSTGQAALEANKHDGGKRQFILCTNNENNICTDICYPRILKVIKGYKNSKGEAVEGLGGNLKYYQTAFVPASPTDKNKELLTRQSIEMLTLKEGTFEKVSQDASYAIYKSSEKYTGIIFEQLAFDRFKKAVAKADKPISLYIFSLADEDFSDDFADMKKLVKICAIPESILRVYRRIFK
ncbi:MAG: hypothetical protein A2Z28_03850 [Chloroflexi bacterium RBG_16_51_9]|nr:MAG: hypothetical protein A2Z28_03850 [Chloroflexi bacterium RBG_16_51_9]